MSKPIVVYMMKGCPFCDKLLKEIEDLVESGHVELKNIQGSGHSAAPTIVLPNGQKTEGYVPREHFEQLMKASAAPPPDGSAAPPPGSAAPPKSKSMPKWLKDLLIVLAVLVVLGLLVFMVKKLLATSKPAVKLGYRFGNYGSFTH